LADEFEEKFVRLKITGKNQFEFSYFRHTGQWFLVVVLESAKNASSYQSSPELFPWPSINSVVFYLPILPLSGFRFSGSAENDEDTVLPKSS